MDHFHSYELFTGGMLYTFHILPPSSIRNKWFRHAGLISAEQSAETTAHHAVADAESRLLQGWAGLGTLHSSNLTVSLYIYI